MSRYWVLFVHSAIMLSVIVQRSFCWSSFCRIWSFRVASWWVSCCWTSGCYAGYCHADFHFEEIVMKTFFFWGGGGILLCWALFCKYCHADRCHYAECHGADFVQRHFWSQTLKWNLHGGKVTRPLLWGWDHFWWRHDTRHKHTQLNDILHTDAHNE